MSATETPVVPAEEVVAAVPTQEEADIFPQPTSMDSEPESETTASDNSASGEEAEDTSSDTSSQPEEMREWIDKVDAIQYYFQADDYDKSRSFNYFKDADGKTLKITEFYCGDKPYININNKIIVPRNILQGPLRINKNRDGTFVIEYYNHNQIKLENVSVDLIMEAMMVLGDDGDSGSDSGTDSGTEEEAEEEEQSPAEEEKPVMNASQQSVVNFLSTFFLLVMIIKAVGFASYVLSRRN